ncbi:activated Cdc42 kinase [Dermatophagoides farinae]|uniref:non-specific protein-tyrosine kinase n=1 Tax=Dermatophagoides farinae TaxID=6954 RepID=A0A9D4SKZ1_DERFA|nr:activated CDC42 kinase 1-like [Dermatophagoides farinae]KAH7645773.1 ack-like kinase domain protein [Dermatophagoides farinae]
MGEVDDFDPLYQLLKEVQLEHFYQAIKSIDVTKVEHFDNVVFDDLINVRVGMGAPAARRLLEAAKKRNNNNNKWKKNLFQIILPNAKLKDHLNHNNNIERLKTFNNNVDSSVDDDDTKNFDQENRDNSGLTCLISSKDIKLLDKIGDGSFGVVMRAQWTRTTNQENHMNTMNKTTKYVAVKVLKQQEILSRALEDFTKEVNAMHQLKHENLIRLYGIVLSTPMMMVTELAEQGSLRTKLIRTQGKIPLSILVNYSIQIGKGMDYLETKRLIHRDLATRNIFITLNDIIKIGDFGLMRAVPFDEDYYTMSDNMKVPFPWCALESLKYRQFSHSSDTWMYGVTLWEIFSFGQEPWAGLNGSQIIRKLEQNERLPPPDSCSQRIYQVMMLCWNHEPKERPTFTAIVRFFKMEQPFKLKALQEFDGNSKSTFDSTKKTMLKLYRGDEIEIIEGNPENYWWKGQNQRTFEIGYFPRSAAKDMRSLKTNDISKPLKNSFIHTGHMDPTGKKSWGNPEFIEKMYLENPIEPQDLIGFESSPSDETIAAVILETRNGRKNLDKLIKEGKIEKISNLNDLDVSNNLNHNDDNHNEQKEGVLIDFENDVNHVLTSAATMMNIVNENNNNRPPTSINNELAEIKFNTQEILGLYNQKPPPPPLPLLKNQLDNNNRINLSSEDDSDLLTMSICEPLEQQKQEQQREESPMNGSILDLNNKNNLYSKYYMPPFDANNGQLSQQQQQQPYSKTRYYSAVCTTTGICECNNSTIPNQNLTIDPPTTNKPSCQCCQFDLSCGPCLPISSQFTPSVSMNFITPQQSNCMIATNDLQQRSTTNNISSSFYNSHTLACTDETTLAPLSPPPPPLPSTNTTKSTFQTKICKDFIDELEANFSRTKVEHSDSTAAATSGSTIVYPTINPPPKSYKTRRPAPPPPVQKKI